MTSPLVEGVTLSPLDWTGQSLRLLDQLALPGVERWVDCRDHDDTARAIRDMVVRGAPAIGCAAAYGIALAALRASERSPAPSVTEMVAELAAAAETLGATRPTAVNLFWALEEMRRAWCASSCDSAGALAAELVALAVEIHTDDQRRCLRIGEHGGVLIPDNATVLTHCNAGALATGGYGTALGVIRGARDAGKTVRVLADETRPYLQGARLTAWELARDGFDVTVLPDVAAAFLLSRGEVDCVVVGADRIAANGDVANKIGTFGVALAASWAKVPFYVAAPLSTIDRKTATGADIPIEERSAEEMLQIGELRIAPEGVKSRYPAFDVTPADLVTAIVTEKGVARAPYQDSLAALFR